MSLARLDRGAGAVMVERIAGNAGFARDLVEEIVARADGVPLFIEELSQVAPDDFVVFAAVCSCHRFFSMRGLIRPNPVGALYIGLRDAR
jgi:hypothetical protein